MMCNVVHRIADRTHSRSQQASGILGQGVFIEPQSAIRTHTHTTNSPVFYSSEPTHSHTPTNTTYTTHIHTHNTHHIPHSLTHTPYTQHTHYTHHTKLTYTTNSYSAHMHNAHNTHITNKHTHIDHACMHNTHTHTQPHVDI